MLSGDGMLKKIESFYRMGKGAKRKKNNFTKNQNLAKIFKFPLDSCHIFASLFILKYNKMKKYSMIMAAMFMAISFTAYSQSKVPAVVKTAFNKKFPAAKEVEWGMEGKTQWEAEFELNEKDMSANFDLKGNLKETETDLEKDAVPSVVMNVLKAKFPGYKVKEAAFTETPKFSAYEIVIKKGESKKEVTIDKTGKILKTEKGGEESD